MTDIPRNMTFGEANVERVKYIPLYKIEVKIKTKHVIYVGKLEPALNNTCLRVEGVKLDQNDAFTYEAGLELFSEGNVTDVMYPVTSFVEITKLSNKQPR